MYKKEKVIQEILIFLPFIIIIIIHQPTTMSVKCMYVYLLVCIHMDAQVREQVNKLFYF